MNVFKNLLRSAQTETLLSSSRVHVILVKPSSSGCVVSLKRARVVRQGFQVHPARPDHSTVFGGVGGGPAAASPDFPRGSTSEVTRPHDTVAHDWSSGRVVRRNCSTNQQPTQAAAISKSRRTAEAMH